MCSACALAAMAGATSGRAWLALHVPALADPRRMRIATATLMTAGVLVASVGLQGSSTPTTSASHATPALSR